jgi:hypothetical protein
MNYSTRRQDMFLEGCLNSKVKNNLSPLPVTRTLPTSRPCKQIIKIKSPVPPLFPAINRSYTNPTTTNHLPRLHSVSYRLINPLTVLLTWLTKGNHSLTITTKMLREQIKSIKGRGGTNQVGRACRISFMNHRLLFRFQRYKPLKRDR